MPSTIWTDKTKFPGHNKHLLVDASSYNDWIASSCYVCDPDCFTEEALETSISTKQCLVEVGRYNFYLRTFPTHRKVFSLFGFNPGMHTVRAELDIAQGQRRASISFTGPVLIPILGDQKGRVWMSLTPMEVFTQRAGLRKAKGRVLVAGLGMGWLTSRVLAKKSVKSVTQVELVPEVVSFFGEPLLEASNKLEILQGDVWSILANDVDIHDYDTILFDIWPKYGDARWDSKFGHLKQEHPGVWGWGDFDPR